MSFKPLEVTHQRKEIFVLAHEFLITHLEKFSTAAIATAVKILSSGAKNQSSQVLSSIDTEGQKPGETGPFFAFE